MSQVALSLGKVSQVLGELYGEEVQKEFEAFRSSTGLGENPVVYRDAFHDGSVTIRYTYALDNHPIAGILRFGIPVSSPISTKESKAVKHGR